LASDGPVGSFDKHVVTRSAPVMAGDGPAMGLLCADYGLNAMMDRGWMSMGSWMAGSPTCVWNDLSFGIAGSPTGVWNDLPLGMTGSPD
jgi:hypothetical protein